MRRFVFVHFVTMTALFGRAQDNNFQLDPSTFHQRITAAHVQLLDVRTMGEYTRGHIANTLQADWNHRDEFEQRVAYLDKKDPVYVYCAVGGRSAAAASWMRQQGFTAVWELTGGFINWKKAGLPEEAAVTTRQMTPEEYWKLIPAHGTVLVDVGAVWCPPCVKMEPVLKDVAANHAKTVKLLRIDAGTELTVQQALKVDAYPTLIIYKNGKETWRHTGVIDENTLLSKLGK